MKVKMLQNKRFYRKKQSIATSSALNEEAKKQLAELAEKLEAAQNEYKDAVAAQTALQNSINNATDAWNVALDVKNKAFDQKSRYAKWGTAMRKYFNETNNVYYVSDMGYALMINHKHGILISMQLR